MNSKAGSVPIWASEQTDFKLKPARPWFSFPRFLTRHLSALTWISNMGQDFPLSHSVYYNRTTSFGTCFKGRWISWCGTSVTDVILFRLWLITSNTHMDKAVGKGPSLTLTMSNNNLSFSVTPFFPVFLITKWSHLQCLWGGLSEPTKHFCDASIWQLLPKLQFMMHHISMALLPKGRSGAAGERDILVLQSDTPQWTHYLLQWLFLLPANIRSSLKPTRGGGQ